MFATFAGFLDAGDEVICMEPFFDQYIVSDHHAKALVVATFLLTFVTMIAQHHHEWWQARLRSS